MGNFLRACITLFFLLICFNTSYALQPNFDQDSTEPTSNELNCEPGEILRRTHHRDYCEMPADQCFAFGLQAGCNKKDIQAAASRAEAPSEDNNDKVEDPPVSQTFDCDTKTHTIKNCGKDETGSSCDCVPNTPSNKRHNLCIETSQNTGLCCTSNVASNGCDSPTISTVIQMTQVIATTVQQIRSSSVAGTCASTKEASQLAQGVIAASSAICVNEVNKCKNACSTSTLACNPSDKACQTKLKEMKSAFLSCAGATALNLAQGAAQNETLKVLETRAKECRQQVAANEQCLEDEFAINNLDKCDPRLVCFKPEYIDHENCKNFKPPEADDTGTVGQTTGSSFDDDTTANPNDSFATPDCDLQEGCEDVDGYLAESPFAGGNDTDTGASPTGGGGSGGLSSGGSGGGGSNSSSSHSSSRQKTSTDKSIIKGSSSGNGYVSRFRGSSGKSGGGGYRNSVRARGLASSGATRGTFNLKKFLPKSTKIKKGAFKNYNRLPSGQLMAPQSYDIFKLHHQSYENACLNNKAIKGCEPRNRKKLGSSIKVSELNSQYRSQVHLSKELRQQKANFAHIRIKSLKNNVYKNAKTTYYQLQYMKKNNIASVPHDLNTQPNSVNKVNGAPAASQNNIKMNQWVQTQVKNHNTDASVENKKIQRFPASKPQK